MALLTCKTHAEAAKQAGVSDTTLYRWMHQRAFRAALDDAERDLSAGVTRRLAAISGRAVDELEIILKAAGVSTSDKLRAIQTALDMYPKLRHLTSIEGQLQDINRALFEDEQE